MLSACGSATALCSMAVIISFSVNESSFPTPTNSLNATHMDTKLCRIVVSHYRKPIFNKLEPNTMWEMSMNFASVRVDLFLCD